MKVMRTPKMDVVRFTESDVIVASGSPLFGSISYAGDGNNQTLSITVNNDHTYDYAGLAAGLSDHVTGFGNVSFELENGESKTIEDLYYNNESNGSYDGNYYSYDNGWTYKHQ